MSQGPTNEIGSVSVTVTADTAPLQAGLEQAKQQVAQGAAGVAAAVEAPLNQGFDEAAQDAAVAGKNIGDGLKSPISQSLDDIKADLKEMSSAIQTVSRLMLILETARRGFSLGQELRETFDLVSNTRAELQKLGSENPIGPGLEGATESARLHLEAVKAAATDAKKFWVQVYEQILTVGDAITGKEKLSGWVQKQQFAISEAEARLQKALEAERKAAIQKQIDDEIAATVEGVEKIELARAAALKEARRKYGSDSDLESAIQKRYDYEAARQKELDEQKRLAAEDRARQEEEQKARDLAAIEDRKNAYMDFIRKQEAARIESEERIARTMADAMKSAYSEMARSLDLQRLSTTMAALNANMEKLTRQRFAAG